MMKRVTAVLLCVAMMLSLMPAMSLVGVVSATSTNLVVLPSNNGKTNNTSYTIGAGTDAEVTVTCDFRASGTEPTASITPKYVTIHNTGTYVSTANAYNTHRNTAKISSDMAWHYTVDDKSVYQALEDNRKGWHVGKSYSGLNSNDNSIGIEMCVHNFPATETFDGEKWTDGTAIMNWYVAQFDQTMKNTAYLALVLCKRWGLNWETDIKMHYDALSYYPGGKDCPMQMRATYDPVTNTFTEAGSYVDGRDGYFWQIFWGYVQAYAAGATSTNGNVSTAEKLGTYRVTPSDGLNVRSGPSADYEKVTALECDAVVKVTEFSGSWGKVTLSDGTEGWCNITDYGEYIGIDALAYESGVNSDAVSASFDGAGSLTLSNNSTEQGQYDLYLPLSLGTATTPYLSWQATALAGDGFYFGLTQNGSGYFMMFDGTGLTEGTTASYQTGVKSGEINLADCWQPADGQRIDQVRVYLAPNSSVRLDYFYMAATSGKVVDSRYNLMLVDEIVNLMDPTDISIADTTKPGSYVYSNGMLTVTADTDAGFEIVFGLDATFDVTVMTRFLIGIEAHTDFNVSFLVTHAAGEGWVTLVDDYYPNFGETKPTSGFIPAWTGTAGLDLYNYYHYNGFVPADNMSTVKQMKVTLGSAGTSYFNAIQIASNDRIKTIRDSIVKQGDTYASDKIVIESEAYTVREDGILGGVTAGADVATMLGNITSDYTVAVYENGVQVDSTAVAKTGQWIKIFDGETELASYEVAVLGDVNGDGDRNTSDARVILASLTNVALEGVYAVAADLDGTGEISSSAARVILTELIA